MDYESRSVKWYWLLLFIVYCAGVVTVLFRGNPYLYSHKELRASLLGDATEEIKTIPATPSDKIKAGDPTFYERYNFERTGVDPKPTPRSKNYEEYEHFILDFGVKDFVPQHVAGDDEGFYVTGPSDWLVVFGLDGKLKWKFKFLESAGDDGLLSPMVDEGHVYVIHPRGDVAAIHKPTGELHWILPAKHEIVAKPFFWRGYLVLPVKPAKAKGVELVMIQRSNGQRLSDRPKIDVKPNFEVAHLTLGEREQLIVTSDNKVIAFDPEDWKPEWTQALTDPIRGPAMVADGQVYVTTLAAKVVKIDGLKKGKLDWEVDLEKPAASAPTHLPIMHRLAFLDTAGDLVAIDTKAGKLAWRLSMENRNPLVETWSSRLKGNFIEEFKMDWLHKGWTIWAPCSDKRFCIFTPNKGQLVQRVALVGAPMALPVALDKRLVFFTRVKTGQYAISHAVEDGEIKRLRKEAQKDQQVRTAPALTGPQEVAKTTSSN